MQLAAVVGAHVSQPFPCKDPDINTLDIADSYSYLHFRLVDVAGDSKGVYKGIVELLRSQWAQITHPAPTFRESLLAGVRRQLSMALRGRHPDVPFRCAL